MTCPYCQNEAEIVGGDVLYPSRPYLEDKQFYCCQPCGAHVGCHPGSLRPLGTLANAELRAARSAVHKLFDPLWQGGGDYSRGAAYAWLRGQLGLSKEDCHVGMFDLATCARAVDAVMKRNAGAEVVAR